MKKAGLIFLVGSLVVGCSDKQESPAAPMIRIARKARESGNPEAAIGFYSKAISISPRDVNALLGIAEAYIDQKLLDAAMEYIKKAEDAGCNTAMSSYLRGKVYLLLEQDEKAEKEFLKNPSIDSMNALGALYDGRGEHQRAQKLYKEVIAKNTNYIDAYNNMGLSLMLCKKYKEAIFYLESACALPEANVAYRSNLALAYGLSGNVTKAKAVYAQDFEGNELKEKLAYLEDIIAAKQK